MKNGGSDLQADTQSLSKVLLECRHVHRNAVFTIQLQGQVAVTGPTGPTKPEMAFKRRGLGRRRRRKLGRRVHPRSVWC